MDLNLRFRNLDEHGDMIEMVGSYQMATILAEALAPKVKALLKRFRQKCGIPASEDANINITNQIIEFGSEENAHLLMIYCELIDEFDLPDTAGANEGYF